MCGIIENPVLMNYHFSSNFMVEIISELSKLKHKLFPSVILSFQLFGAN